ncbi:hypothetical protein NHN26_09155 [Rhodovulum tesquicola]|uniref:Uncharacterized protein n=1 Tax=Rhodovulum steppense TaxID=540251 RepID=A0A4R1YVW6_9RHOB|nr:MULTISPECIES: hypothetical protein [Rhodovulum]MCO8145390.1 hypothetical protein [Rhodovulum tesquicola]TCM85288.1 hypothetical protein EV216_108140 [Rhodovulum steppense]
MEPDFNEIDQKDATEAAPPLSAEDIASRILGFTRFCAGQAGERLEQAALSRGWIDEQGRPTADGCALIAALTSRDCAYGVYRLPV